MDNILYTSDTCYLGLGFGESRSYTFLIKDDKIIRHTYKADYWSSSTEDTEVTKEEIEKFLLNEEKALLVEFNKKLEKITNALDKVKKM
jgi:hypothetical protein